MTAIGEIYFDEFLTRENKINEVKKSGNKAESGFLSFIDLPDEEKRNYISLHIMKGFLIPLENNFIVKNVLSSLFE